MKKYLSRPVIIATISASILLSACSEILFSNTSTHSLSINPEQLAKQVTKKPVKLSVSSMDDLNAVFNELQYTRQNWNNAGRAIPRIIFSHVGEGWVKGSPQLPVATKKSIFFRLMTPLILVSNEKILREREIVENVPLDAQQLIDIAFKYQIIDDATTSLNEEHREQLLARVDILPASLALAQAAEESGWGTSRFALEGNAFFGQWDFSGNGMKPKQQRAELGNYGVARFATPLASVEAYMFNINTNRAYQGLRLLRTEKRTNNRQITGYKLAATLDKYSERGEDYTNGLRQMIRYNKLDSVDDMLLSNERAVHLVNTTKS